MTFLAPLALLALLVGPAIYLVHLLRSSRRRVRVAALFLWADLPRVPAGHTRRRWPPLSLLLVLQLVAGLLAALALGRPASPGNPPVHLALVLDASPTMQATDVSPSRFEAARARARERLNSLGPTDAVSLIRAGTTASLLASGPRDVAGSALSSAQAGLGTPAIREALALASAQVAATPDRQGQILLVTDLAWPMPEPVGLLAAPVEVLPVGGGADNQAIVSLQVRMDPSGRAQTAFVELGNQADHPARVLLRLTADNEPLDERQVDMAARTHTRLSIPLPTDARRINVRLLGHDALALDDTADAVAPGGPAREVVLIGRAGPALRRALEALPFVRLHLGDAAGPVDLTVLEGVLPAQLPPGPLLVVNPPASSGRLLGVGLGSGARVQPTHPLLQGLDLAGLQAETPSVGGVPGWADVVLGTLQGPLIMAGSLEGRPAVALTFDPALSGLDKSLAFPLLISNATAFLLAQAEMPAADVSRDAFDPSRTDITPRPAPSFEWLAHSAPVAGVTEAWPWLVGVLLVILGAEWLVFARRG